MKRLRDTYLWSLVSRTVTPLGQPRGPRPSRLERFVEPSTVDLHGLTIREAHNLVNARLDRLSGDLVFITGRSGEICREFPDWANLHRRVRSVVPLNSGGAFRVTC